MLCGAALATDCPGASDYAIKHVAGQMIFGDGPFRVSVSMTVAVLGHGMTVCARAGSGCLDTWTCL